MTTTKALGLMSGESKPHCPMCGHPLEIVWVHGHGQCAVCTTNIEACCQGAPGD